MNKLTLARKALHGSVFAAMLALGGGTASAAIATYPGAFCAAADRNAGQLAVHENGTLANNSTTQTLHAICPIHGTTAGSVVRQVTVRGQDRNCDSNVSCKLIGQSMTVDGGVINVFVPADLAMTGCGTHRQVRTSTFSPMFVGVDANLVLSCRLPARTTIGKSSVMNYSIDRN